MTNNEIMARLTEVEAELARLKIELSEYQRTNLEKTTSSLFVLENEGTTRATLGLNRSDTVLKMYSQDGIERVQIRASNLESTIRLNDAEGFSKITMRFENTDTSLYEDFQESSIFIQNRDQETRLEFSLPNDDEPEVRLNWQTENSKYSWQVPDRPKKQRKIPRPIKDLPNDTNLK